MEYLNTKHFEEWHTGSGVPLELIEPNVKSINSRSEVFHTLGWKCPADSGWFVSGVDPKTNARRSFGQFKSDTVVEIQGKAAKYLTPKGVISEPLFLYNKNVPDFWQQVLQNNTEIYITEGAKKAGSLLRFGKACIGLTGVWNGLVERKHLKADLALFAKAGCRVFICFDADQTTNINVRIAIEALRRAFEKLNCSVTNVVLPSHTKGLDDYLLAHTLSEFESLCESCAREPSSQPSPKLVEAVYLAKALSQVWTHKVIFDKSSGQWFCFHWNSGQSGIWSEISLLDMQSLVIDYIDTEYSNPSYSFHYVSSVIQFLKTRLNRSSMDRPPGTIPFRNGLYFLATNELKPYEPEFVCTFTLAFDYAPGQKCDTISRFLSASVAPYYDTVPLLLAILGLALTQNTQYQIYFELYGPGGSGKSTFINLLIALLGVNNVLVTDSHTLEHSRFETASLKGKNAIIVTEGERFSDKSTMIKRIVGNDLIRYEKKYEQPGEGFYCKAILISATNELTVHSDASSGLFRRRVVIPFANRVPGALRSNLITIKDTGSIHGDLARELPGLMNEVISVMQADRFHTIEPILRNPLNLAAVKRGMLETFSDNSVSFFATECLIFDKRFVSKLGFTNAPDRPGTGLYMAYTHFCEASGIKPMSIARFSKTLYDLCRNQLLMEFVSRVRKSDGMYIEGVLFFNYDSAFETCEILGPSTELPLMERVDVRLNPKLSSQTYKQSEFFPTEVLRIASS